MLKALFRQKLFERLHSSVYSARHPVFSIVSKEILLFKAVRVLFLTRNARINALSSLANIRVFIFTSTMSAMTSHRILITA